MMQPRITIITGPPATGKSTVSQMAAKISSQNKSVHMHTDDFYHYIQKGTIPPYLPEAQEQNTVVITAFLSAAEQFAKNGYDVFIDGIVGPWFLEPWKKLIRQGIDVHYFILRATKEETLRRAINRSKLTKEENIKLVESMWGQFNDLGEYEGYVVETTDTAPQSVAESIVSKMADKKYLL